MRTLEMPNAWAGMYQVEKLPTKEDIREAMRRIHQPRTFSIPYKGFVFSGVHSLEIEDEYKPVVVTIELLFIDDSCKDVLAIVDPAVTYWLEDELARN